MEQQEAVRHLLSLVNDRFGLVPSSPSEFDELGRAIHRATRRSLSASTLKRCWGYMSYAYKPTLSSLNILAAYAGFEDWPAFLRDLRERAAAAEADSGFLPELVVSTNEISPGREVIASWAEGKGCRLRYEGDEWWRVVEATNIKLMAGDRFRMSSVSVGLPLYATDIRRGETRIPGYLGARAGVLSLRFAD